MDSDRAGPRPGRCRCPGSVSREAGLIQPDAAGAGTASGHARRMSNWTVAALIAGTGAATVALAAPCLPPASAATAGAATTAATGGQAAQRDERAAGVSPGRDDQRVGRHRTHHHPPGERQDRSIVRTVDAAGLPRQLRGGDDARRPRAGAPAAPWLRVGTGDDTVAVAEREALGTTARVAVWPPGTPGAGAGRGRRASWPRWTCRPAGSGRTRRSPGCTARGGGLFTLSDGLAEAVGVALAAARWTGGLTDPTVGDALIALGYDRDFAAIDPNRPGGRPAAQPGPGLAAVRLDGPLLRLPPGSAGPGGHGQGPRLGPGRRRGLAATGPGRRCSGQPGRRHRGRRDPPRGGWPILAAGSRPDRRRARAQGRGTGWPSWSGCPAGAVATSSVTCRSWRRAGRVHASHRGSPHRPARRRALADGQRRRGHLRRRQRRRHRGDRGRRPGRGLAGRGGPAGPAGHPRRRRCATAGGWPAHEAASRPHAASPGRRLRLGRESCPARRLPRPTASIRADRLR